VRGLTTPASLRAVLAAPMRSLLPLQDHRPNRLNARTADFRDQPCTHLRQSLLCPWVASVERKAASDALGQHDSRAPGIHRRPDRFFQRPQHRLIGAAAGLPPDQKSLRCTALDKRREVNSTVCVLHRCLERLPDQRIVLGNQLPYLGAVAGVVRRVGRAIAPPCKMDPQNAGLVGS